MNPGLPVLQAGPSTCQDYLFISHVKKSFLFYSFSLWGISVIFLFWHFNFLGRGEFVKEKAAKIILLLQCPSRREQSFSFWGKFVQYSEKRKILISLPILLKSHMDCAKNISYFYHVFTIFSIEKENLQIYVEWCSSSLLSLLDPYVI